MADVVYELIKGVPFISAKIYGRERSFAGRFVVDTGAAITIVRTARIDALGFSARDALHRFYRLIVPRIDIFHEEIKNVEIAAMDFPPKYQIDGLIGMNLLSLFDFSFFPQKGIIRSKRL